MATLAEFRLPGGARRTMRALASVVCTERVEELGIGEAVVDQVELFLASIPGPMRAGIVAGIYAFEHSARVTPGIARSASAAASVRCSTATCSTCPTRALRSASRTLPW